MIDYFSLSGLINGVTSTVLGFFVISRNVRNARNITYFLFSLSVSFWSYFYFLWQISKSPEEALLFLRLLMGGAIFIPTLYLHHVFTLLNLEKSKGHILKLCYFFTFVALVISFTPYFVSNVSPKLTFKFWPNPGFLFHPFLFVWAAIVVYGGKVIFSGFRNSTGLLRNQMKYIFVATLIGWTGGATNYFLWYDIPVPPFGNILVSVYVAIAAFVIVRFRLMDVSVVVTRTSIFLLLYTVILGIPLALVLWGKLWLRAYVGSQWWVIPLGIYLGLTTIGPFLYLVLQRKAEDQLLKDQHRYQQTLLQASRGMTLIKDLNHLVRLIAHMLTRTIRITHASVYLNEKATGSYERRAARGQGIEGTGLTFTADSAVVKYLVETRAPIATEELRFRGPYEPGSTPFRVQKDLEGLKATVVIPSFIREELIGFLILGDKKSKEIYTVDDFNTLTTLANQAALAFENCEFIKKVEETQLQLFHAAKMADLGTMASGIGHQINNRLNVIKLGAESGLLTDLRHAEEALSNGKSEEAGRYLTKHRETLRRISESATHGGEIVRRLLDFSKLSEGFTEVKLDEALESTIALWQCKRNLSEIDFQNRISQDLPPLWGNFTEIEEIMMNLLDNGFDAVKMKEEAWELGTLPTPPNPAKGRVVISASPAEKEGRGSLEIIVEDSGIGMTSETQSQIFVPFFTTKATAIKGRGLGLYVIKRMVDAHRGEISLESEYGKGTTFHLLLPTAPRKKKTP
ncbi:MAG: GAF domain-containing protein [Candidatus Omnitrophica bacterium]|nr:GAF domain-containing protein [Candidatus Omnitrophota bacterium]